MRRIQKITRETKPLPTLDKNPGKYIVCGLGTSLNKLQRDDSYKLIGVNDCQRTIDPDYLVVLDPLKGFTWVREQAILDSEAIKISHLDIPGFHKIHLSRRGEYDLTGPRIPASLTSPFVAVGVAYHLGATHIGIIGVDFTENHSFEKSGEHILSSRVESIDKDFAMLRTSLERQGIELYNLSPKSRLKSLKKISIKKFKELQ